MEYQNQSNQGKKPINVNFNGRRVRSVLIAVLLVIVALTTLATAFYTVDEKESAVVTTFGRVSDVTGAGIHFKVPFGIQQVYLVEENVYQKIELGYRSYSGGEQYNLVDEESKMITGDYNIVNVDFFVE